MKTPLKPPAWAMLAWAVMAVPASSQSPEDGPALAGDTLTLERVLELARERSPMLAAMRASADAAAYREPAASTLPDPMVELGIMNFGIPDLNTDMPTSMAPSVQVMQMVPFPGKLSLMGDIASLETGMAGALAEETWWDVRARTASMYWELYAVDRRLAVMRETLALLTDFQQVAKAMYVAGEGRQADVLRADVEVARMDGEIRTMEGMRRGMAARLNAMLDLPADAEVATPVLGSVPLDVPAADTLGAWARATRPTLERARLGVAQSGKREALMRREIWPDLTVGFQYGQRDAGMGTERMGSAMLGFTLPIHAGKRQYAARDEARAMTRMAEAELAGVEAEVDAEIAALLAELRATRDLVSLYRDEVVPEARATVESAFSSYRVGAVDFMTLVDAQMTVNEYQGELFGLLGTYGKAVAALESAVGRPLPRTGQTLLEAR